MGATSINRFPLKVLIIEHFFLCQNDEDTLGYRMRYSEVLADDPITI